MNKISMLSYATVKVTPFFCRYGSARFDSGLPWVCVFVHGAKFDSAL
jgi:hypothetical protein